MSASEAGKRVSDLGGCAGVYVDAEKIKPAGCHDFRRSFGTRWSKSLMPVDLKALMRHADISTTMKYYVSSDADDLSARMWIKMQENEEKLRESRKTAED